MATDGSEKFRMFHQSPAPGSPEERLERMVNEIFGGMRGRNGRAIDYDIRRNKVHPARSLASKLAKAKRKGVPRAQVLRVVRALDTYINERFPEQADEFPRPRLMA